MQTALIFSNMEKYIVNNVKDFNVNGDLTKCIWNGANRSTLRCNRAVDIITEKTQFKALCSDKYLYLAFSAEDSCLVADLKEHNQDLYNQDVVEFFITLDGRHDRYLELEFNINNAMFWSMIGNDGTLLHREYIEKNVDLCRMASVKTQIGYDIEVRIDIQKLNALFENDLFSATDIRFNAYRINLMKDGEFEYSAFNPTDPPKPDYAFHYSRNFGVMCLNDNED